MQMSLLKLDWILIKIVVVVPSILPLRLMQLPQGQQNDSDSILVCLQLPIKEKTGLSSSTQHLEMNHGMTFVKMLGYTRYVDFIQCVSKASRKYFCIGIS